MKIFLFSRPVRSAWCWLLVAVFGAVTSGCALWDHKKTSETVEAKPEREAEGTDGVRRPGGPKRMPAGLDPQAKEIERNLGVR